MARLQVVFSELEQRYAALAVEQTLERRGRSSCRSVPDPEPRIPGAKKDNVLDCTVPEGKD
jgi:hypothetical protein